MFLQLLDWSSKTINMNVMEEELYGRKDVSGKYVYYICCKNCKLLYVDYFITKSKMGITV